LYAWTAFLNDKAAARGHLEAVQRIRIRHSRPIRDYEHDDGPSPPSAPSAKLRACYNFVFYLFGILGTAVTILQLYNAAILRAFTPFFTVIVFQLTAAMFQFMRIILVPPE
jgi:hypothetical protein